MNLLHGPMDKESGAYYTESRVAEALCRWALRRPGERLLDPAFGGGVFLEAGTRRGAELGGGEVFGVELDPAAYTATAEKFGGTVEQRRLVQGDFFSLDAGSLPTMHAVVGNPPFIRFQRFRGEARKVAVQRCRERGVPLSPLAGSWVAFVAHSAAFLTGGGRLAMVVPAELGHAPYARSLLALLHRSFGSCTIVSFRSSLFPHLDQRTVLLLADGYGQGPALFRSLELPGPNSLDHPLPCVGDRPLDAETLTAGRSSLAHAHLDPAALALYRDLGEGPALPLGGVAKVESGYVTGANAHFHLSREEASRSGLPDEVLIPAVFRSRALSGLALSEADWTAAADGGGAGFLVQAHGHERHPAVASFLDRLEEDGIHRRYKTRNRAVWHHVPRVIAAPLLLAAMGGQGLRMVFNDARVAAPNTFHLVTPHHEAPHHKGTVDSDYCRTLSTAWLTSLTRLSIELEGHALGGGLLKCDPGEASQVLMAPPSPLPQACLERLDRLMRSGEIGAAQREADRLLLGGVLGLSDGEIALLANAASELAARRHSRS